MLQTTGVLLIEDLVREPSIVVRAWKCESHHGGNDSLRSVLLHIRRMSPAMTRLVVMTSHALTNRILAQVLQHRNRRQITNRQKFVVLSSLVARLNEIGHRQ